MDFCRDKNGWIYTESGEDWAYPPEPEKELPVRWKREERETWIDENLEAYLCHIEGAVRATLLYYAGDGEFIDGNGFWYRRVDKWQELPAV